MSPLKAKYGEGDVFAVPLDNGSFAIALIARRDDPLGALGYFFGPRRSSVPTLVGVGALDPSDAFWVCIFSALHISQGSWPRIGRLASWDRDRWPVPGFRSGLALVTDRPYRVDYDDKLRRLGERLVTPEEFAALPEGGTYGSRAVEMVLSHRLPGGSSGSESGAGISSPAVASSPASPASQRRSLFDNDDAMDLLGSLVGSRSGARVQEALDAVLLTPGYLQLPEGNAALAAAELLAAAAGFPAVDLPASASTWVARHRSLATAAMLEKAPRAIERVAGPDSELRELWSESASKAQWERAVEDLAWRLEAARGKGSH